MNENPEFRFKSHRGFGHVSSQSDVFAGLLISDLNSLCWSHFVEVSAGWIFIWAKNMFLLIYDEILVAGSEKILTKRLSVWIWTLSDGCEWSDSVFLSLTLNEFYCRCSIDVANYTVNKKQRTPAFVFLNRGRSKSEPLFEISSVVNRNVAESILN